MFFQDAEHQTDNPGTIQFARRSLNELGDGDATVPRYFGRSVLQTISQYSLELWRDFHV